MARRKKPVVKVTVKCASCGNDFEMDSDDYDHSRKPWCSACKQASLIGNKFEKPTKESKGLKREYYRANRAWFRRTADDREGVVRVKKDWKDV